MALAGRVAPLGEYDAYQARRGAHAALEVDSFRPTGEWRGGVAGALDRVRRRAEAGLVRGLPEAEASLLRGMVLGQDERLSEAVRTDFQRSGLAHLLAVSGQNVVLLAMLALGAGMVAGLRLRARLAVALILVLVYVPLAGGGPSIQRAGVMGAAGLVAALAGRPASRWYALGLAVVVTLALNPRASGEVGWQLSFAAVVGLLALAPRWREGLRRARLPGPIADAAAVTAAATVATAPLMALYFQQVSLASLPANLAAAPAVAPVMWLGMLAIAAAQVSPALCVPLNALNGPLLAYVEWVAHVAAAPPAAALPVRVGGPVGLAATYAAAGAAMLAAGRVWRWLGRHSSGRIRRAGAQREASPRGGRPRARHGRADRRAGPARRRRAAAGRARDLVPRRRPGRCDAAAARRRLDPRRHRPARRADPPAAAGVRRRAAGHAADHPRRGGPRGDGARDRPRVPASARAQRRRRLAHPGPARACRGPPSRRTPASA